MKIVNVMNFVRQCEPRFENADPVLFESTRNRLALVNEFALPNTFLLQYDVLCDEKYVMLFKENAGENTEFGLWYEIVAPLTDAVGLPYRSEKGWQWDWHIIPGFSMGYTPSEREMLIDQAMKKFKEVFGYYPKTVGSWLIDTHTVNYLTEHYEISALCNCRDQVNVDAYSLVGGYFNQAYYPSKTNMFTPAQTAENRINVPMFRLLGASPIHNYDETKFSTRKKEYGQIGWTLEPVWYSGYTPEIVDWFFRSYFVNEDLGFSYAQLGQENGFELVREVNAPLRMQIEKALKIPGVRFQKMCDTGDAFRTRYPGKTPATAVVATDNWDTPDIQSVYYDCQKYVINVFRYEKQLFIRAWYLFDDTVCDHYLTKPCESFYALYENMPIVDTARQQADKTRDIGLLIDEDATPFTAEKDGEGVLLIRWGEKSVRLSENAVCIQNADTLTFFMPKDLYSVSPQGEKLCFRYGENEYAMTVQGAQITQTEEKILMRGENIAFFPESKADMNQ